jgi:uncharacterized protein with gpF-like domain
MKIEGINITSGQWSAILDKDTCSLCEELDGKIFNINNIEALSLEPPVHINCRCIIAYIGEDEMPSDRVPNFKMPSKKLIEEFALLKRESDTVPYLTKTIKGREIQNFPVLDDIEEGEEISLN